MKRVYKLGNWIVRIILKLRRKTTLNVILFALVFLIARESTGFYVEHDLSMSELISSSTDILTFLKILILFTAGFYNEPNFWFVGIYILLFLLVYALKKGTIESIRNKALAKELEKRNEVLAAENAQLAQNQLDDQTEFDNEKSRIINSLKRRGVSTEKLIRNYSKPLKAIIVSYSNQMVDSANGGTVGESFILDALQDYNVKYMGGSDCIIPPSHVPAHLKNRQDLSEWFENDILAGRYCKIKFMALVDLREELYWFANLPYQQISPNHRTIGEIMDLEDLFGEEQIKTIAISDIIRNGDIVWLATSFVTSDELHLIQINQELIEDTLDNPTLSDFASDFNYQNISNALQGYVNDPDGIATRIVEEAKYWLERLT